MIWDSRLWSQDMEILQLPSGVAKFWGSFFGVQPRVVRWRGNLAGPEFIYGVVSRTQHWVA